MDEGAVADVLDPPKTLPCSSPAHQLQCGPLKNMLLICSRSGNFPEWGHRPLHQADSFVVCWIPSSLLKCLDALPLRLPAGLQHR